MGKPPTAPNPAAQIQADLQNAFRLHQSGNADQARALYESVLKRAPQQPDALNLLGILLADKDDPRGVDLIARAAQMRPKDPNVLNNLGNALIRINRHHEAVEPLERAIAVKPDLAEAYGNLIVALRYAGRADEALHYIGALRRLKGESIVTENETARLYADMGRRTEARALYEKITREHPQFGPAWLFLAETEKAKPSDPLLDALLHATETAPEPSPLMKNLCLAAGKVLDDLGEYDRAWGFFMRAKRQEPQIYDAAGEHTRNEALKKVFDDRFFAARRDHGVDHAAPIFIVGMPRSGTTLAEQILSAHRDVAGGGELSFMDGVIARAGFFALTEQTYPEVARTLTPNAASAMAFSYLRQVSALNLGAVRVTDKMPHNFRHLGLIALLFKQARIIHCLRNPLDVCLSAFMHDFSASHGYNRALESLGHQYNIYRDLMAHWATHLPLAIHAFDYETVLDNQQRETEALLAYAGLDWDENALAFHKNERRVTTPSNWQVRAPLYKTSAGRWRNYEKHLGPLIDALDPRYRPS